MEIEDITGLLERFAPRMLQEDYDNAGLLVGNRKMTIHGVLISVDMTDEVMEEAIAKQCDLIITHHPLIFKPLKRLNGDHYTERLVMEAIRRDIAIYSIHTNIDSVEGGVSSALAAKLGLKNTRVLSPRKGLLRKLATFVPEAHAEKVREAIFSAGAGMIGNYSSCSFNAAGQGTFLAQAHAHPFIGEIGKLHVENEIRIETVFPQFIEQSVIKALIAAHPYEEVAYDIYPIDNEFSSIGYGIIGEIETETDELPFLEMVKQITQSRCLRYSPFCGKRIRKVAVCGGSGAFLIKEAEAAGADVFITGDLKYHDFFEPDGKILLADIGHFESEQFVCDVISSVIKEKFPNFANFISGVNTNPLNCLY